MLGEVTSRDGTTIAHRRYGSRGAGVIMVHGGAQAAQNLHRLAEALADEFIVYVVDRRGRGRSGPAGDHYGLATERADLEALIEHTDAVYLFGLSSGGIIVLSTALATPSVRRLAVYEPPLSVNHSTPIGWLPRYEQELARGDLGAAAVTAMRGTRTAGFALRLVPRRVMTAALNAAALNAAARPGPARPRRRRPILRAILWPLRRAAAARGPSEPAEVALRDLVPTMRYDARVVQDSDGTLDDYAALDRPVLLLGGSRSTSYLTRTLDSLQRVLPRATRVELPRVGHTAPDNTGQPLRVAAELRQFFTE